MIRENMPKEEKQIRALVDNATVDVPRTRVMRMLQHMAEEFTPAQRRGIYKMSVNDKGLEAFQLAARIELDPDNRELILQNMIRIGESKDMRATDKFTARSAQAVDGLRKLKSDIQKDRIQWQKTLKRKLGVSN